MKQAILVVGTGRSGTSVMAGILKILGAYLGENLKRGDRLNQKGYFENTQLTDLNKELLLAAGIAWYEASPETVLPVPVTPESCNLIRDRVQRFFGERSPIAFKDPRLCVLLDAYVSTMRDMGYETHCVRMIRKPADVAKSLIDATRVGTNEHWLPMIKHHATVLDDAVRRTVIDCIDCTFENLVEDTKFTVEGISRRFHFLACSAEQMREILEFVDKSLKHHG